MARRGTVIKLFEPYGKIAHFDYLWHTSGPKRGEPRGFCFVEYRRHEVGTVFPLVWNLVCALVWKHGSSGSRMDPYPPADPNPNPPPTQPNPDQPPF